MTIYKIYKTYKLLNRFPLLRKIFKGKLICLTNNQAMANFYYAVYAGGYIDKVELIMVEDNMSYDKYAKLLSSNNSKVLHFVSSENNQDLLMLTNRDLNKYNYTKVGNIYDNS
jgi:hypothetical protein